MECFNCTSIPLIALTLCRISSASCATFFKNEFSLLISLSLCCNEMILFSRPLFNFFRCSADLASRFIFLNRLLARNLLTADWQVITCFLSLT
uniref:Putative secreted protein n=1 Tax=Panstrongylus lignarius TaxID=156445 RepID=A0A224XVC8_9HEMI